MPDIVFEPGAVRARRVRLRALAGAGAGILIALLVWALRPASHAPSLRLSDLWIASVQEGPLSIVVSAAGVFTPMEQRWLTAGTPGTVESIKVQPGDAVSADTVLLVLSNPVLESTLVQAQANLASAEASRASLHAQLTGQLIALQASLASARTQATTASLKEQANRRLYEEHIVSELDYKTIQLQAQQNAELVQLAEQQLTVFRQSMTAQDHAAAGQIAALKAVLESSRERVESLSVRARLEGVVQDVAVHAGETLILGSNLAKVASLKQLKITLQVPANEASQVAARQTVRLELATDSLHQMGGRVIRVSPAVDSGTVAVDVMPDGAAAAEVRPGLAVTGEIHVADIPRAVYVLRPANAGPGSRMTLYRLEEDGHTAVAATVRFGAASDHYIQIMSGLKAKDRVIASDTSSVGGAARLILQ
jgi:HlyD family secretion protein